MAHRGIYDSREDRVMIIYALLIVFGLSQIPQEQPPQDLPLQLLEKDNEAIEQDTALRTDKDTTFKGE